MAKKTYPKAFEQYYRRCKILDGWPVSKYDQAHIKAAMHSAWQARGRLERAARRSLGLAEAASVPVSTYVYPMPSARGLT